MFTEPLRVGAGLVATEFALERENLDRLLPNETKKPFKKVLDLESDLTPTRWDPTAIRVVPQAE